MSAYGLHRPFVLWNGRCSNSSVVICSWHHPHGSPPRASTIHNTRGETRVPTLSAQKRSFATSAENAFQKRLSLPCPRNPPKESFWERDPFGKCLYGSPELSLMLACGRCSLNVVTLLLVQKSNQKKTAKSKRSRRAPHTHAVISVRKNLGEFKSVDYLHRY